MYISRDETFLSWIASLLGMRSIGAPSEIALYARGGALPAERVIDGMPESARMNQNSTASLEHDSASLIRRGVYCSA